MPLPHSILDGSAGPCLAFETESCGNGNLRVGGGGGFGFVLLDLRLDRQERWCTIRKQQLVWAKNQI